MIVIDASVVLELLLRANGADEVGDRVIKAKMLCAPDLLDLEVVQVLRRLCLTGNLSEERASEAFEDFRDLGICYYPDGQYLDRVWELRGRITAYDAVYIALAEALSVPLLTRDQRLAKVPGHAADVEVV